MTADGVLASSADQRRHGGDNGMWRFARQQVPGVRDDVTLVWAEEMGHILLLTGRRIHGVGGAVEDDGRDLRVQEVQHLVGDRVAATVVVEAVFAIPGMGNLIVHAAIHRDFPVVQGVVFAMVLVVVTINLLADVLYGVLDPRIA